MCRTTDLPFMKDIKKPGTTPLDGYSCYSVICYCSHRVQSPCASSTWFLVACITKHKLDKTVGR